MNPQFSYSMDPEKFLAIKNGNFKTGDFSPLIKRVLAGVSYHNKRCLTFSDNLQSKPFRDHPFKTSAHLRDF